MDTLKTAVVVLILLAVLYGVYTALNQPNATQLGMNQPSSAGQDPFQPNIDFGERPNPLPMSDGNPALPQQTSAYSPQPFSNQQQPIPTAAEMPGNAAIAATQGMNLEKTAETVAYAATASDVASAYVPAANAGPAAAGESAARTAGADADQETFLAMWQSAQAQMAEAQWKQALLTLSMLYSRPGLTAEQRQQLLNLLDPLAAKVIYSTEHHLTLPHEVSRGETLIDVAKRNKVPWLLLSRINAVKNPEVILPGTQLKVVEGPFRAEVQVESDSSGELTMYLGRLYAGRFPVTIGQDPAPTPGDYVVHRKQAGHPYYGGNEAIPAGDARNPFGEVWIDLGHELCIHGSPASITPQTASLGCISLSPTDAQDIFGMLSEGSQVSIRR